MKKLKRGFEASKETVTIKLTDGEFEVANLLKSGIVNQTTVLFAVGEVWHEVSVLDLGADNSELNSLKQFIEGYSLCLEDLGIQTAVETKRTDYDLKQADFEALSEEFPLFNYIQIAKLDTHVKANGGKSGMYEIRQILKMLTERGQTIDYFITDSLECKAMITGIKGEIPATPETSLNRSEIRIEQLEKLGLEKDLNGFYSGFGFAVGDCSISTDSDSEFSLLLDRIAAVSDAASGNAPLNISDSGQAEIPVVIQDVGLKIPPVLPDAPPVKKPVSLETIGSLKADRIAELQGLKEKQLQIVDENPFTVVTDKKSLEVAKKYKSNLLKASTAIDGKEGMLTNFVKHANQFIKMGKDYLNPIAKISRDAYDKQSNEITRFENEETLRILEENRLKLEKIKKRTDALFAVPFTFNGELYSIGTLYVLPSQIEDLQDAEFDVLVKQGEAIHLASQAVESEKDAEIRRLREKLAALGIEEEPVLAPAPPVVAPINNFENAISETAAAHTQAPMTPAAPAASSITSKIENTIQNTPTTPLKFQAGTVYAMPAPNNKILNAFDMMFISSVQKDPIPDAFIKCREFFKYGNKQVAEEIIRILNDADQTVKKSVQLAELAEILKNS